MSRRNGDRARFQKNRKRKLLQRERYRNARVERQTSEAGTAATDATASAAAASR